MRISNRENLTLGGPDIFLYGRTTLLHPQFSAEIHSNFRARPWWTCEPLAPSKLPFINNRMHLFKSHRGSVCIEAAKLLFCSKAVWCERKAAFVKHSQVSWKWCRWDLCRFLSPGPTEILKSPSSVNDRTIQRPPCLLAWSSNPDVQWSIRSCAYSFPDMAIRPSCIV